MKNNNKTKEQLILEIEKLKHEVAKQKKVKKTFSYQNGTIEILEHILDGIVVFDKNMNYVYVNNIAAELLGTKPADLTGKNYWKEYPEAKGSIFANNYVKAIETQSKIKFESYYEVWNRWFENRIYPFQGGIIILFTEITQRKKEEAERIKFSLIIEESPTIIVITDSNANIKYVNKKFLVTTKYSSKEVYDKNPSVLKSGVHTNDFYKDLWETISSGKNWSGEFYNKKKNGEFYYEAANIFPIFDSQDKISNFIKISEDITERKENEKKLKKYREHLEELVKERTKEVEEKNKKLSNQIKIFVGRELKIKNLENEIRELKKNI